MTSVSHIRTKYFGPTNNRGSRIKATLNDGPSITIPYPYELSGADCHMVAVDALCKKLEISGWAKGWVSSYTKGGYIFIAVE